MTKIDSSLFDASSGSVRQAFGDCPECGSPLHILNSKKGKFLGCTAYPDCTYSQSLQKQNSVVTLKVMDDSACPECNSALAVKKGRYGMFIGCTNFPDCHYILNKEEAAPVEKQVKCPSCKKGFLRKRANKTGKAFYSCDQYPRCKYLVNEQPLDKSCPECGAAILFLKMTSSGKTCFCGNKQCGYEASYQE